MRAACGVRRCAVCGVWGVAVVTLPVRVSRAEHVHLLLHWRTCSADMLLRLLPSLVHVPASELAKVRAATVTATATARWRRVLC